MAANDRKARVLITDIDNTLYDWFDFWHTSFTAMVAEVLRIKPSLVAEDLYAEMRSVFQKHGTSEYAFVLQECPSLKELDIDVELAPAVESYRNARSASLSLYPAVMETLKELRRRRVKVIAYTESIRFYTADRLKRLQIDELIDVLYSPADHVIPIGVKRYPDPAPSLMKRETPPGETKPNVDILQTIIREAGARPQDCVYIGDSRTKDIAMARAAGVKSVLAEYGSTAHRKGDYELLKKVSHWTDADIEREKHVNSGLIEVHPDFVAHSFSDILQHFEAPND